MHWKTIGAGGVVTTIMGLWAKWRGWRKDKAASKVDAQIIRALQDHELWSGPRPFTGSGDLGVRSAEIAQALSLDIEVVIASLDRLEARGRVRNAGGTLNNPAPYWHIIHR